MGGMADELPKDLPYWQLGKDGIRRRVRNGLPEPGGTCLTCGQVVRKKYANAAARAKAWRERKKADIGVEELGCSYNILTGEHYNGPCRGTCKAKE